MKIELIKGDITSLAVDAIVNAANSFLAHGGGVAGAIVAKGGEIIQQESDRVAPVEVGHAAVTSAGKLPSRYVIHAVGPIMGEGHEDAKLRSATHQSLLKAEELEIASIAFPAISTGIFGYPITRCAPIMIDTVRQFRSQAGSLQRVIFCLFSQESYDVFERELREREA